MYLHENIVYYAHKEFTINDLPRHVETIILSKDLEYKYPSEVYMAGIDENVRSIDLSSTKKVVTFISDRMLPESDTMIVTVCVLHSIITFVDR